MCTGAVGLGVVAFLSRRRDVEIVQIRIPSQSHEYLNKVLHSLGAPKFQVISSGEKFDTIYVGSHNATVTPEAIVSAYWPWIISEEQLRDVPITVNLHPALLPYGRGWYPHVHNILDGTKAGVTLHEISFPVDSGAIWAQEAVEIRETDTARDLHARLETSIQELFFRTWPEIESGNLSPAPQPAGDFEYFSKNALDQLDCIDLKETGTWDDFLKFLRARTFGDVAFAHYLSGKKKIGIRVHLEEMT